eukprot:10931715-Alexandrium_andersonii.AAC.1
MPMFSLEWPLQKIDTAARARRAQIVCKESTKRADRLSHPPKGGGQASGPTSWKSIFGVTILETRPSRRQSA